MARNQVVAGDYKGLRVDAMYGMIYIACYEGTKNLYLNKDNVENYTVLDAESHKSAGSAVGRAAVGGLLLGPVGLVAGVTAKKKSTYSVQVDFRDGKRSLLEIDGKRYKALMESCF